MRLWTGGLLAVAWLLSVSGWPDARAENRALFIGIDDYQHIKPKLLGAVNDARRMQAFAQRVWGYRPQQTRLLLDREASRDGILSAIRTWLLEGTQAGEQVLLYYSGHGFYTRDENGDEDDGQDETLVSVDAYVTEAGVVRNMVIDDDVQALLEQMDDRQVMVIIDSCHSGTATRSVELDTCRQTSGKKRPAFGCRATTEPVLSRAFPARHRHETSFVPSTARRIVWSAVSATQEALEDMDVDGIGGVFTSRFMAGVEQRKADANTDGQVTYVELLDYVQRESERYCQRHQARCPLGLTPTLEASREIQLQTVQQSASLAAPSTASLAQVASEVLTHPEDRPVRVDVLPGTQLRLGQAVQLRITSPVQGYLLVLQTTAAQELLQRFPDSRFAAGNRLTADRPQLLPVVFQAAEVGPGRVFAVVTVDSIDLSMPVTTTRDVQVVPNPHAQLADLSTRLRQIFKGDTINRRPRWLMGQADYQVNP